MRQAVEEGRQHRAHLDGALNIVLGLHVSSGVTPREDF